MTRHLIHPENFPRKVIILQHQSYLFPCFLIHVFSSFDYLLMYWINVSFFYSFYFRIIEYFFNHDFVFFTVEDIDEDLMSNMLIISVWPKLRLSHSCTLPQHCCRKSCCLRLALAHQSGLKVCLFAFEVSVGSVSFHVVGAWMLFFFILSWWPIKSQW